MSRRLIVKDAIIINEGSITEGDLLIVNERIEKVGGIINVHGKEIIADGKWLMPGIIDDQVHFREPGLTHKADIASESRAAVAGGVTTFMEMPNTKPAATTQELLEAKYQIAKQHSVANYSFFMGTTNDNLEEIKKIDFKDVCGLKIFMGSSTGNMLVDNHSALNDIFSTVDALIATHCEDEASVKNNTTAYLSQYGDKLTAAHHPLIRNEEACYKSSSYAVDLAKKYDARLHVLHISTAEELALFSNELPLNQKRITAEACVHHLFFTADDYERLGNQIKCNPAIKDKRHAPLLFEALLNNTLDIIATDHAPHSWEEKQEPYVNAPSGLPLVQHSINIMLDFYQRGMITKEQMVEKMCHAPAICFRIAERGFIREGYYADLALIDADKEWTVSKENIKYKCGWSPLEGRQFKGEVTHTIVSGNLVFENEVINEAYRGMRLRMK